MESVGLHVVPASSADLAELAGVAARTFPLACPPSASAENVAAFVAENLSATRFADYLADPDRVVLIARDDTRILGYAMLIRGVPDDDDVQQAVSPRPAIELSKMYVLPESHGTGASPALMTEALTLARDTGYRCVWLGVNQENRRAQRFYAKHGFAVTGTKTFRLGDGVENDFVMVCPL
ncbi:GNAT family N-acetyltransferase [Mycolicibacterium litorale]|uniref:N-acetyltransferase n=1 Tax=Mycolicibacterium litorale TaxID=758802 RepID=A0AAD1MUJ5_9MYCO|nr:GNAT family N-acetyltransferase [Mycolicibacterium litorale]MCV7415257.1 GNAT family N-acetyltransferase [Mycolicibacterium litorale]TDY08512.1 ribosomal protein S18 acetylase RimI-like enzyme [Mycolicibacterium litorale]BBY16437.1 N-acetyltransferase [Mycolicibacterium litorale]